MVTLEEPEIIFFQIIEKTSVLTMIFIYVNRRKYKSLQKIDETVHGCVPNGWKLSEIDFEDSLAIVYAPAALFLVQPSVLDLPDIYISSTESVLIYSLTFELDNYSH